MTDPRIDLAPTAKVFVVPGRPAAAQPELWLNSPAVVLHCNTGDGRRTIGSRAWLWGDDEDWRFDADSGVLTSVVLNLPEVNMQTDTELHEWHRSPTVAGTLRLEQPEDFSRPPTSVRCFNRTSTELIGWYSPEPPATRPRRRIALADRTHLLIAGDTVVGWAIKDPARYITGETVPSSTRGTDPDERLPPLLATFFSLVTEENVDKMEEGDSRIRSGLQRLAVSLETVRSDGEPRAAELLTKVRQVLEDFGG